MGIQALAAVVGLSAVQGLAGSALAATSPEAQVDAIFAAYTATTPGCAVGVEQGGKVLLAKGYGAADLEAGRPLTPQSGVYMASVSKQLAAMAVLLLVEDGKLRLDQPVRPLIPELPAYADKVTVAQLLHHTSGLRDYFTLGALDGLPESHPYTEADVLRLLGRQQGLNFEPGSEFLYSNSGYVLLSILVHRVSGQRLDDFARARMFTPLGMTHSRFQHDHNGPIPEKANGYQPAGTGWRIANSQLDVVGDGGLYSSVDDMLKWLAALDRPKVGARALAQMRASARLNDGSSTGYGMGLSTSAYRGLEVVAHGGALAGYRTADWWFPAQKLGVVVLCNTSQTNTNELAAQVAAVYLGDRMKPPTTAPADKAGESARRFVGLYRLGPADYREYALRDGDLAVSGRPLAQVAPGAFVLRSDPDGARIAFDPAGAAVQIQRADQPTLKGTRVTVSDLSGDVGGAYLGDYSGPEASEVVHVRRTPELAIGFGRSPAWTAVGTGPDRVWLPSMRIEVEFTRDAAGKVSGLVVNTDRARGLRYSRVAP